MGEEGHASLGAGRLYTPLALAFSFLWASAFIAVKTALARSPPLFLMGFRFAIAGGPLGCSPPCAAGVPARPSWARLSALGLLNHAIYLGLSAIALDSLAGSTGSILASTNPLMVALAAAVVLGERPSRGGCSASPSRSRACWS